MTAFIALAALMLAAVLAGLLWPLLFPRGTSPDAAPDTLASNAAIYREQLAELEAEHRAGSIDTAQWEQARREIERRALEEVPQDAPAASGRAPRTAIALGLLIPLAAVALYLVIGNPDALDPQARVSRDAGHNISAEGMAALLDKLEKRLQEQPGDAEGWTLLGRSRARLQQFAEAAAAYKRALALQPDDANLMADYADVLAMTQGRKLEGEPARLVERALKLDPQNVKALSISGTIAFDRKDYNGAIRFWQRALALVPADSGFAASVRNSIAEAEANGGKAAPGTGAKATLAAGGNVAGPGSGTTQAKAAAGKSLSGRISLAAGAKVNPEDTVFVFARPAQGQRMPIAIQRRKASELPLDFTLDDSMAMNPSAKLSDFAQVVVVARVSATGQAEARPGDLEAVSAPVALGSKDIRLVLGTAAR